MTAIRTSEFAQEVKSLRPNRSRRKGRDAASEDRKAGLTLTAFWPVAVGLFLSGFATEWHQMATQAGEWAMRITFPFALLATHREIGIDDQMAEFLPQFAVFAQLPIDGLLMSLSLAGGKSLKMAILQTTYVHLLCAFVLWLLTYLGK